MADLPDDPRPTGQPPLHIRAMEWPVDLGPVEEILPEGTAPRGLLLRVAGESIVVEAILLRTGGHFSAFENQCRHWPVLLDFGDGDFLSPDGRLLQCRHHGALYDPETGRCVAGPCMGARLRSLSLRDSNGRLYLDAPPPPEFED